MKVSLLFCVTVVPALLSASVLDLSSVVIRHPARENPQQKMAVDELERHLRIICGSKTNVADGCVFVFGRPDGEPTTTAYTWHVKRKGSTVWLWGDDKGTKRLPFYGSAFAVYEFFEHALGVRWVGSGDDDIVFDSERKAELPEDWRIDRMYGFTTALLRRVPVEYGYRLRYAEKRPFKYGHAFRGWQKRYLKDHPEYFCLSRYGTRGLPERQSAFVKLCLSNEATVDRIVGDWQEAGAPKYLNVCPNDGTPGYCFCEGCLKLDADLPGENFYTHKTDRYLNFWNRIVAKVRKVRPDVQVISYIYSYYRFPPRREHIEYPENMIFGMVPSGRDDYLGDLRGWQKAGLRHFFLRPNYTSCRGELPVSLERYLYDTYHRYLEAGSVGFDYDGIFQPYLALEYYVLMRTIDRPELPFEVLVDEFCSQYGAAAKVAKTYFARLRTRADAGRIRTDEQMKEKKMDVLDDSELSSFSINGHTANDLVDDLKLLATAPVGSLSPVEHRRWQKLVDRAAGYPAAFERARMKKAVERPLGPEGWRTSFDLPSYQGWKTRDLKAELTNEDSSFDRWSIRFETQPEKKIALWRQAVPMTPGAKYKLSFDVKFDEGFGGAAGMRVVADGSGRRPLAVKYVRRTSAYWQPAACEFEVPGDVTSATVYFAAGPGGEGQNVWLDNVMLERLSGGMAEADAKNH